VHPFRGKILSAVNSGAGVRIVGARKSGVQGRPLHADGRILMGC
jgi:hypothetical protein